MGEPAFLMRSFSHPSSASREGKEGDPYRALTESISFGRFMSESLAWEKWSTFSHNRYLEEVEQFSKPGSVAQKKAFFEAHYKKRAAMKAAGLLEQPIDEATVVPELQTVDYMHDSSAANSKCEKENDEETSILDIEVAPSADKSPLYRRDQRDSLQNAKVERDKEMFEQNLDTNSTGDIVMQEQENDILDTDPEVVYTADDQSADLHNHSAIRGEGKIVQNVEVENSVQVGDVKRFDNAEGSDLILATPENDMVHKETGEKQNLTVPSNKRQLNSSSKSSGQNRASKLPKSSAKNASSNQPKAATNVSPSIRKSVFDLVDKKKSISKYVHMSINFGSRSGDSKKDSPILSRNSTSASRNPARTSVLGASNLHCSLGHRSEDKRTKALLNRAVSGGVTANRMSQGLSGSSNPSSASGSKGRPPIVSCPFSFRSEERAQKRKEFFRKLEEKNNTKEAEQAHLRARPKDKPEHDHKMLRQSTGVRAKPTEDLCHGLQSSSNYMKKMARPQSPKPASKPSPSDIREASSGLSRKPISNSESSKHGAQKHRQSVNRSVSLLPRKKAHENASPNIQR